MKRDFPEFYIPAKEWFDSLWQSATIVLDASVLLQLYRYSDATRKAHLAALRELRARLWIPYQVGLEFQRNRLKVIDEQSTIYANLRETVNSLFATLDKKLNEVRDEHLSFEKGKFIDQIQEAKGRLIAELDRQSKNHPSLVDKDGNDPIRSALDEILEGRVGKPFSAEELTKATLQAEGRTKERVPPGFADQHKPPGYQFGDVILWLQTIAFARESKKPIIFVTNDDKEDWWNYRGKQKSGPHPSLLREMRDDAGVNCWIYDGGRFLEYANQYLENKVPKQALREVREAAKIPLSSLWSTSLFKSTALDELAARMAILDRVGKNHAAMADIGKQFAAMQQISRMPFFDASKFYPFMATGSRSESTNRELAQDAKEGETASKAKDPMKDEPTGSKSD